MPLPTADITRLAAAAEKLAGTLSARLNALSKAQGEANLLARWAEVRTEFDKVDQAMDELTGLFGQAATSTFATFLTEVGGATVEAQRRLDQSNRDLVREAVSQRLAPGGVFQIPKVSGEVKFALTQRTNRGLNLIFHSKGSSSEERNEQTLSFDIVSVPPPPELLRQAGESFADANPLIAASQRAMILDTLIAPAGGYVGPDNSALPGYKEPAEKVDADRDGALVFRIPRDAGQVIDPERYMVIWAEADGVADSDDAVGIWEVDFDAGDKPIVHVIWQIKSAGTKNEDIARMRAWVRLLARQQKALRDAIGA